MQYLRLCPGGALGGLGDDFQEHRLARAGFDYFDVMESGGNILSSKAGGQYLDHHLIKYSSLMSLIVSSFGTRLHTPCSVLKSAKGTNTIVQKGK